MDFSLCSQVQVTFILFKFIDYLQEECNLGHSGCFGYLNAISEFIDFRKVFRSSSEKFVFGRTVYKESTKDDGKNDEIEMDARSRH